MSSRISSPAALAGLMTLGLLLIALLWLGQPAGGWWARWSAPTVPEAPTAPEPTLLPTPPNPPSADALYSPPAPADDGERYSATALLAQSPLPTEHPERRLIEVYAHIERGEMVQALQRAQALVADHPNFQLAHLIHGDLLRLRYQPTADIHDSPGSAQAAQQLQALRAESRMRLQALTHRPAPGTLPSQLLAISQQTPHAIAIDASKGRLYWFEHDPAHPGELRLAADYFISVGKAGIRKQVEGDGRTPLGLYHVTAVRDRKGLPEFYGAGALPLNYPNAFDTFHGRTGSGIWLHGTPPNQFVRAPLASDGCVVLANTDMSQLLQRAQPRVTPVVIAERLQWVQPSALQAQRQHFEALLQRWQRDRARLTAAEIQQTYRAIPSGLQRVRDNTADWTVRESAELGLTHLDLLYTTDPETGMVATFEETVQGRPSGVIRRQHWLLQNGQWRLVQDSIIAGSPDPQLRRSREPVLAQATPSAPVPTPTEVAAPRTRPSADRAAQRPTERGSDEAAVRHAIQAWSQAWTQQNMSAYLRAYDASFTPPGGQSRKAWEKDRSDRILGKTRISLSLQNLRIRIEGDRATATFVQHYKADRLAVSSRKTLKLIRRGAQWRITHESVG